jgi:hypothetical protein
MDGSVTLMAATLLMSFRDVVPESFDFIWDGYHMGTGWSLHDQLLPIGVREETMQRYI